MVSQPTGHPRVLIAWSVLQILLVLEAIGLLVLVVFSISSSLSDAGVLGQIVSLILMCVAMFVWVAITAVGSIRSRASWVRGSAVTIHVLMFAAGSGCLQLAIGPWWLGLGIIALALVGFAAAIMAQPKRNDEETTQDQG